MDVWTPAKLRCNASVAMTCCTQKPLYTSFHIFSPFVQSCRGPRSAGQYKTMTPSLEDAKRRSPPRSPSCRGSNMQVKTRKGEEPNVALRTSQLWSRCLSCWDVITLISGPNSPQSPSRPMVAFKRETSASSLLWLIKTCVCNKCEGMSDLCGGNNVHLFFWLRWIFYALILQ